MTKLLKCERRSENYGKEARFQFNQVKRMEKDGFFKYERKGKLGELFLCEEHATFFHSDRVNYEIKELK